MHGDAFFGKHTGDISSDADASVVEGVVGSKSNLCCEGKQLDVLGCSEDGPRRGSTGVAC